MPDINVVLKVLSYLQLSGKAADMNVPDEDGCTPLIIASMCNNVVVVRLLVDAGADKNTVCQMYGYFEGPNTRAREFRLTALDLALREGHTEIVQLLSG